MKENLKSVYGKFVVCVCVYVCAHPRHSLFKKIHKNEHTSIYIYVNIIGLAECFPRLPQTVFSFFQKVLGSLSPWAMPPLLPWAPYGPSGPRNGWLTVRSNNWYINKTLHMYVHVYIDMFFCYRERNCFYTHTLCEEIHIDTPLQELCFFAQRLPLHPLTLSQTKTFSSRVLSFAFLIVFCCRADSELHCKFFDVGLLILCAVAS